MLFKDPLADTLQQQGYNLVRLPRTKLNPLDVLASDGTDLVWYGGLETLVGTDAPLPAITRDVILPSFSGDHAKTGEFDPSLGLGMVGTALAVVGAGSIGLDAALKRASKVCFSFIDPRRDEVSVGELNALLKDRDVHPISGAGKRLFNKDVLYVITAVIKSQKFKIDAQSSSAQGLNLDASKIQAVVGGKLHFDHTGQGNESIQYEGDQPLVFGFQAVRLEFGLLNHLRTLVPVHSDATSLRAVSTLQESPAPGQPDLTLLKTADSVFLNLSEADPATD